MGKRYFEENLQRSYTALNTEKALKYFAIISVLLHLGFNLKKSSRMITLEQKLHNWYSSAKKGALMLETHLKIQVTLPELAEDRQAHAGGFTKARAMSQAQPARCFLAFHSHYKAHQKWRNIVWYLIQVCTCRLYHSSAIPQGYKIHWEPCKTEEIP